MLFVTGGRGDLRGYVLDQLIRVDRAVLVFIRRAFQALHHVVAEYSMTAAELRTFDRNFLRAAGEQAEHISLDIAQVLHIGVDGGVLNRTDGASLTDIDEEEYAADVFELLLEKRAQLRHGQSSAGQILRVGIVR